MIFCLLVTNYSFCLLFSLKKAQNLANKENLRVDCFHFALFYLLLTIFVGQKFQDLAGVQQ